MEQILIVEDDQTIRDTLQDILEIVGYKVLVASDGNVGYDIIVNNRPDLVLCDVSMPKLGGFELLELVNQRMVGEINPLFLFITGKVGGEDFRQGMNLGADDYIFKPFNSSDILKTVRLRLDRRKVINSNFKKIEELSKTLEKVETNLQEEVDMLQLLVDVSTDGYWDWRIDFTIPIEENYEYISPKFWMVLGYEPEEKEHVSGSWINEMFDEDCEMVVDNFNKHVESKGEYKYEQCVRYKHKNGNTIWVLRKGEVVKWSEDGTPLRMVGSHTDVTKLKQTEKELNMFSKSLKVKNR